MRVISGETDAQNDEPGLTADERAAGWVLSCVRVPSTNTVIEADCLPDVKLPNAQIFPSKVLSIEDVAPTVRRIVLKLPPRSGFSFLPGQYVRVSGPEGLQRSYSLAGANAESGVIELHIRYVSGGVFSRYWFEKARVGDLLRIFGPLGTFFLRSVARKDLIFLATGTGIAPIQAMIYGLEAVSAIEAPSSMRLYWGNRTEKDIYLAPGEWHPSLRYFPTLSRAAESWQGGRSYVQDEALNSNLDASRAVVYACGSGAMIRAARDRFKAAGLPEGSFFADAFVCSS